MSVHSHATIPSLDGFRAVSIAIVFSAHAGRSQFLPGGFGVTVFFFLSGFLITTLFYREVARNGTINLRGFYIRRILRLSPPLLVTLGLTYSLVATGAFQGVLDPPAMLSQAFYYYNYYTVFVPGAGEGALGLNVLWSLAVEEHFYMVYPFLFLALLRTRLNLAHMGLILGGILLWRILRYSAFGTDAETIYMSTDTRFDSILYGALLAMLGAQGLGERLFPPEPGSRTLILLGAAGLLLFCFMFRDDLFRATLRYSLQGIALMPIFHYAVSRPDLWPFRPLNWGPVQRIGVYSYTIYLVHTVIIGNLEAVGMRPESTYLFVAITACICIAYAALLFHFVERPVRHLRDRFLRVSSKA